MRQKKMTKKFGVSKKMHYLCHHKINTKRHKNYDDNRRIQSSHLAGFARY